MAYLLPIDLHMPMHYKLPRRPHTTRKHGPKDGRIQPPLQRPKRHPHVRRRLRPPLHHPPRVISPAAPSARLPAPVVVRELLDVHVDDSGDAPAEHELPLLFADLAAVVGACVGFGLPFLLVEGLLDGARGLEGGEVVEVEGFPGLDYALGVSSVFRIGCHWGLGSGLPLSGTHLCSSCAPLFDGGGDGDALHGRAVVTRTGEMYLS